MDASVETARSAAVVNALTIDVEDYFHVAALAPAIPVETWSERELRVERSMERLLALFDERRIHGTFFVLGWVAERVPGLVRRIAAAGHEVACHGWSHRLIYSQSREEFAQETMRSKRTLEDLTGSAVIGYRAASFSITKDSLWALDVLLDLEFRYDSSIFPIIHDRYGIVGASRQPGRVPAPSGRSMVEFPMSTATLLGMPMPASGGGYFRILPYWWTKRCLRQINRDNGWPFTFYLHPWEIDPGQPRFDVAWFARFRHYTNLGRCEGKLRKLLSDFEFSPMHTVLRSLGLLENPRYTLPAS